MDALFRGVVSHMPFTTKSTPAKSRNAKRVHLDTPESYHMPAYPLAREWDDREKRAAARSVNGGLTESRIAHWDNKREKCKNCKLIYLRTLSQHPGFCSVDCKSNAAYINNVNQTISAVRNAVVQMKQDKETSQAKDSSKDDQTPLSTRAMDINQHANTFADYGLESRLQNESSCQVEWAFSAMY